MSTKREDLIRAILNMSDNDIDRLDVSLFQNRKPQPVVYPDEPNVACIFVSDYRNPMSVIS